LRNYSSGVFSCKERFGAADSGWPPVRRRLYKPLRLCDNLIPAVGLTSKKRPRVGQTLGNPTNECAFMLRELTIRNFAIIDDLTMEFPAGLTVLSGETGAGKSILINAVNLLLGSRASSELVRSGSDTAQLEAFFEIGPLNPVAGTMQRRGYDPGEGLLVRRRISRSGSNRIYINGNLATVQILNEITETLASISSQHAHQNLLRDDQHLWILDQFGGLLPLRTEVEIIYEQIRPLLEKRDRLRDAQQNRTERLELLHFQQQEIETAALQPEEDLQLEEERARLKNSEFLLQTVFAALDVIYSQQDSVVERLGEIARNLEKAGQLDAALVEPTQRLQDARFQLEDLTTELRGYMQSLDRDESRLEAVEERLDAVNKLKRKYGGSIESVFDHLQTVKKELAAVETTDEEIAAVDRQLEELSGRLKTQASTLSEQRRKTAGALAEKIAAELAGLNMPQTRFEVVLEPIAAERDSPTLLTTGDRLITAAGMDRARFRIAPNVGEDLKPLASIASGGELSRVVLAIKAILAQTEAVETVIFDEVDAGIGGSTAEVVGRKLAELARYHQVVCITHLPQIAKFGRHHYRIAKAVEKGRTRTTITLLDDDGRIEELARMLGGVDITPTTLEHARELLRGRSPRSLS